MAGTKRSCCKRFCCFSSSASDEEGQYHPASAGPQSSPSAIVNTTETLPGPPKRSEAPIPGSSNVVTPRKDEDEDGQDHPASAGPRSSPSAIDNTTETLPGPPKRSEAPIPGSSDVVTPRKDEIEQPVDPNPDVSRTHQCAKAPLSKSQNIPRKSGGEDVNAHPNVSGATQWDEPSSSGSSNLPVKSEGEHVDVNPNVSEAPSSSSSTGATKSDVIHSIKHIGQADDGKEMDVDLDELVDHISKLLKLREEEMLQNKKASNHSNFRWPEGLKKLNAILSIGTDLKNITELLSKGLDFASKLKDVISGPVTTILKDIGQASVVTAGLLVVAYTLETFHNLSDNKVGCWGLIKEMSRLASVVKELNESPEGTFNVIEEATTLVVEGAITCCTQLSHSGWKSFLLATQHKADLSGITQKLNSMYLKISVDIGIHSLSAIGSVLASNDYRAKRNSAYFGRVLASNDDQAKRNSANFEHVLDAIESTRNLPVSRIYPDHAVGLDEYIQEVLSLLECDSAQNAVTVILHGFGGMGKTTLADAVFSEHTVVSKLVGFKYSKVRMREDSVIVNLQKEILEELMEPGDTISKIKTHQDGQLELRKRLEQVQAFIYIDDVLDGDALKELLPQDMSTAKKVRLLLTARNANVKNACPRQCTEPKIYKMKGIQCQAALLILVREIKDGINASQFNGIIHTCGGIPLMLRLTAGFIGLADNKEEAYAALMEQKEKWTGVEFEDMRYAFAYHAIPSDCKEPFLDICTYFNGWKWDIVEDIVGKSELRTIENRALVDKTKDGFARVDDVILSLAHQMSKEESKDKEVRCKFTNASELKKFLEEDTEGIRGIWLTERKDVPKEEEQDDDRKVVVQASALDKFHKSLRALQLGNSIKVEGNCKEIFKELVFFEAKISQLPFDDVSQLPQLRYLSYDPPNWVPSSLPSSLAIMNFNGKTFQTYK